MSPKSAKSGQYFYYSCTLNNRFGRDNCSIRAISAPELERVVVFGLKEIQKKEDLLDKMTKRAIIWSPERELSHYKKRRKQKRKN